MGWQYALFLAITSLRQLLHVIIFFRNWVKKITSPKQDITGFVGWFSACTINGIYFGIWVYAIYAGYNQDICTTHLVCTGLALLVFGSTLRILTLIQFWKHYSDKSIVSNESELEIKGIYRFVRHPMNLSVLLETTGMIIFVKTWFLAAIWLILYVTILARNKREDTILRAIYGSEAVKYQAEVPSMNILGGILLILQKLAKF